MTKSDKKLLKNLTCDLTRPQTIPKQTQLDLATQGSQFKLKVEPNLESIPRLAEVCCLPVVSALLGVRI